MKFSYLGIVDKCVVEMVLMLEKINVQVSQRGLILEKYFLPFLFLLVRGYNRTHLSLLVAKISNNAIFRTSSDKNFLVVAMFLFDNVINLCFDLQEYTWVYMKLVDWRAIPRARVVARSGTIRCKQ